MLPTMMIMDWTFEPVSQPRLNVFFVRVALVRLCLTAIKFQLRQKVGLVSWGFGPWQHCFKNCWKAKLSRHKLRAEESYFLHAVQKQRMKETRDKIHPSRGNASDLLPPARAYFLMLLPSPKSPLSYDSTNKSMHSWIKGSHEPISSHFQTLLHWEQAFNKQTLGKHFRLTWFIGVYRLCPGLLLTHSVTVKR